MRFARNAQKRFNGLFRTAVGKMTAHQDLAAQMRRAGRNSFYDAPRPAAIDRPDKLSQFLVTIAGDKVSKADRRLILVRDRVLF